MAHLLFIIIFRKANVIGKIRKIKEISLYPHKELFCGSYIILLKN